MFVLPLVFALSIDLQLLVDALERVLALQGRWLPLILSPRSSWLLIAGLAVGRMGSLLFYLTKYHNQTKLRSSGAPLLWLALNCAVFIFMTQALYFAGSVSDAFVLATLHAFSICCNFVCIQHLKSSVSPVPEVALGLFRRMARPLSPRGGGADHSSASLQTHFYRVRVAWKEQIEQLKEFIKRYDAVGLTSADSDMKELFKLVSQLFVGDPFDQDLALRRIQQHFEAFPQDLEAFVPMLVIYLVYGAFEAEDRVRDCLLRMCGSCLPIATKVHWYLASHCPDRAALGQDSAEVLDMLLASVDLCGERASQQLFDHVVPQAGPPLVLSDPNCFKPIRQASNYGSIDVLDVDLEDLSSKEANSLIGSTHPSTVVAFHYPLHATRLPPDGLHYFPSQISFWTHIADISRGLAQVPRRQRTAQLRARLQAVVGAYLPSAVIHVPFGNTQHRVWALHVDECCAFSTKDRAPILLTFEIVHYADRRKKRRRARWWPYSRDASALSGGEGLLRSPRLGLRVLESFDSLHTLQREISCEAFSALPSRVDLSEPSTFTALSPSRCSPPPASHLGQWDSPQRAILPIRGSSPEDAATTLDADSGSPRQLRDDADPSDPGPGPAPSSDDEDGGAGEDAAESVVFKEKWSRKSKRIQAASSLGSCRGWALIPVIVKADDDLRQEQLAGQVLYFMHNLLEAAPCGSHLRPYGVVALSADSGIIEAVPNSVSLDVIKKRELGYHTLPAFFDQHFGQRSGPRYLRAQENFVRSLAAYSVVCYLLNLRDRHNGNILLTTHGHIVHIDFGFILGVTPGGNLEFEQAPFKLTSEYVEIMGGEGSAGFRKFREVCVLTFLELRRQSHRILLLLEMLSKGNENLPCFAESPERVLRDLQARFLPNANDHAAAETVHSLINQALDHWTTGAYDNFQRCCVGIS